MSNKIIVVYRTDENAYLKIGDNGYSWVADPLDATDRTGCTSIDTANPFNNKGLDGQPLKEGDAFSTDLYEFTLMAAPTGRRASDLFPAL